VKQENIEAAKNLLDRWANWIGIGGSIGDGAPRQCPGAPDARIQSFEDLEIENEKYIVQAVNTAVYELPVDQRNVIMLYYGFRHVAWRQNDDALFEASLVSLFHLLKERVSVCK
jgi:hypothetical protein